MIEDVLEDIRRLFESGRRFERKGAYIWATSRYVRAAAMAELLARLQTEGQVQMTSELIAILHDLVIKIRNQSEALMRRLGNGHRGLSGRGDSELAGVLQELVERLDDIIA